MTRGEPGLYFTPTLNGSVGTGGEANVMLAVSKGWYTGDPGKIKSSFLIGPSLGVSFGLGAGVDGLVGVSYAPADYNNLSLGGFMNVNVEIGTGVEISPATVINVQINVQKTLMATPLYNFK